MYTTPTSVPPAGPVSGVRPAQPTPDAAAKPAPKTTDAPSSEAAAPVPLAPPAPSPLKLVVAKAESSLAYSYTLVDQVTGRVVAEIPHQAAQDAAANPSYTAGAVVDTTA